MFARILFTALAMVIVFAGQSSAVGTLYAHLAWSNDDYKPLWLKTYDATTTITDQMAVTHVDQTFVNETGQRLEGIFMFPLPENAIVTELALWENGVRYVSKVMESDTARALYEQTVRRTIDPALLEYLGNNLFKLSVFPIEASGVNSQRRVEVTYAELLPYDNGTIKYTFLMKTVNLSTKPVQRESIRIGLSSQKEILSLGSSTLTTADGLYIKKVSANQDSILYGEENPTSDMVKDMVLYYKLKNDGYAISHLTYTPSFPGGMFYDAPGDNPYFLFWITPPDTVTMDQVIKKNVVFLADNSSSMAGGRIQQTQKALNAMVDMLNPGDKFNIITFNSGVTTFQSNLIAYNATSSTAAHNYVNGIGAVGMTNMQDAFKAAFTSTWVDSCVNVIVFLTDGKPTWPDTNWAAVLDSVAKFNAAPKVSIYSFGIDTSANGGEVSLAFLKLLAKRNNGFSLLITKSDSISVTLESFMQKISHPVIKSLSINYGGLTPQDMYPPVLPNVYAGSQLTVMGRYLATGTFSITVTGSVGSKFMSLTKDLPFPSSSMPNQPFVPRMWASAKINYLLDEIAIFGVNQEDKNAIIALGTKYSIITPYTSMVVLPTNVLHEDLTLPAAKAVRLYQSGPNPFRATAMIQYAVPRLTAPQKLTLKVFDASGKLIRTLADELTLGGNFRIAWDATDALGRHVSPGFYLVVLNVGTVNKMMKIQFVK
jgi:Ca-activated chloride channel homolog